MKKTLTIALLAVSVYAMAQQKNNVKAVSFSTKGKVVTVYTTAENSDLRLTKTNDLKFSNSKQPLETETSIFVEPTKKFQTFMGIGGAITDASAEVFAKLSKAKQQERLL
jgi:glucosylceramidase